MFYNMYIYNIFDIVLLPSFFIIIHRHMALPFIIEEIEDESLTKNKEECALVKINIHFQWIFFNNKNKKYIIYNTNTFMEFVLLIKEEILTINMYHI